MATSTRQPSKTRILGNEPLSRARSCRLHRQRRLGRPEAWLEVVQSEAFYQYAVAGSWIEFKHFEECRQLFCRESLASGEPLSRSSRLASREDVNVRAVTFGALATDIELSQDLVVGLHWVVVKEGESFHLCLDSHIHNGCYMDTPSQPLKGILRLGIGRQSEVRLRHEVEITLGYWTKTFEIGVNIERHGPAFKVGIYLAIGCIHYLVSIALEGVGEAATWMHLFEVTHLHPIDNLFTLAKLSRFDICAKVFKVD